MMKNETPDSVHGRLLESVHLAGYSFGRACDELKWLLRQDRWKRVGPGYDDINAFLATIDFSALRAAREERKDIVRQLAAINAGQRATARALGVAQETVARDLGIRTDSNESPVPANVVDIQQEPPKLPAIADSNESPAPTLRPYYSEAGITIYHGDCRELLPCITRGLMVTDPPYNVGYHYNEYEDAKDVNEYWTFLNHVLRMPLVFIHYPENLFPLAKAFDRAPDKIVAWIYHANTPRQWRAVAWFGTAPDLSRDGQSYRNPDDRRVRELIAAGREARLYDWWIHEQVKNVSQEKTEHPCQLPLSLMSRILRVTPFDGPVIDPFCGSGTTLVAARELERQAIGIECSEEYCEAAANRLRQFRQMPLISETA
jgi:DNA modification methylase